jgi:hypothetical protein
VTRVRAVQAAEAATRRLAETPTRLGKLAEADQEKLINWGYAICDTAMRKHVIPGTSPPARFPIPAPASERSDLPCFQRPTGLAISECLR